MKKKIHICLFVVACMIFSPVLGHAKWVDESDDLPGLVSSDEITTIILVGAAVLGVVLILSIASKDNKAPEDSQPSAESKSIEVEKSGVSIEKQLIIQPSLILHKAIIKEGYSGSIGISIRY